MPPPGKLVYQRDKVTGAIIGFTADGKFYKFKPGVTYDSETETFVWRDPNPDPRSESIAVEITSDNIDDFITSITDPTDDIGIPAGPEQGAAAFKARNAEGRPGGNGNAEGRPGGNGNAEGSPGGSGDELWFSATTADLNSLFNITTWPTWENRSKLSPMVEVPIVGKDGEPTGGIEWKPDLEAGLVLYERLREWAVYFGHLEPPPSQFWPSKATAEVGIPEDEEAYQVGYPSQWKRRKKSGFYRTQDEIDAEFGAGAYTYEPVGPGQGNAVRVAEGPKSYTNELLAHQAAARLNLSEDEYSLYLDPTVERWKIRYSEIGGQRFNTVEDAERDLPSGWRVKDFISGGRQYYAWERIPKVAKPVEEKIRDFDDLIIRTLLTEGASAAMAIDAFRDRINRQDVSFIEAATVAAGFATNAADFKEIINILMRPPVDDDAFIEATNAAVSNFTRTQGTAFGQSQSARIRSALKDVPPGGSLQTDILRAIQFQDPFSAPSDEQRRPLDKTELLAATVETAPARAKPLDVAALAEAAANAAVEMSTIAGQLEEFPQATYDEAYAREAARVEAINEANAATEIAITGSRTPPAPLAGGGIVPTTTGVSELMARSAGEKAVAAMLAENPDLEDIDEENAIYADAYRQEFERMEAQHEANIAAGVVRASPFADLVTSPFERVEELAGGGQATFQSALRDDALAAFEPNRPSPMFRTTETTSPFTDERWAEIIAEHTASFRAAKAAGTNFATMDATGERVELTLEDYLPARRETVSTVERATAPEVMRRQQPPKKIKLPKTKPPDTMADDLAKFLYKQRAEPSVVGLTRYR